MKWFKNEKKGWVEREGQGKLGGKTNWEKGKMQDGRLEHFTGGTSLKGVIPGGQPQIVMDFTVFSTFLACVFIPV